MCFSQDKTVPIATAYLIFNYAQLLKSIALKSKAIYLYTAPGKG